MSGLILVAPLQGWVAPLDEAPDPVFAERMMGDGLAIDPTGSILHAPCTAQVLSVHRARHAVSLRAENGAEILLHIGLETVALGGEGLTVHVSDGQTVAPGDRLISFDIDALARSATSLLTPIVLTNGEAFAIVRRAQDQEVAVGDFLMEIEAVGARQQDKAAGQGPTTSRTLISPLVHGVHARPAAIIANTAKGFSADIAISAQGRRANAKSPMALMALAIRPREQITISASGPDAAAAIDALADLILTHLGERPASPAPAGGAIVSRLTGVMAAPGLAIGTAARFVPAAIEVPAAGRGADKELAALTAAIAEVRRRLEARSGEGAAERRAILGAHLAFLDDLELNAAAERLIGQGRSAGRAWREAIDGYVAALRASPDARLAARADDLADLERQVLMALGGVVATGPVLPENAILLADQLLPSELLGLDAGRLAGLCTARGGPTSHVAILAAAMNIPALVAAGPAVLAIEDGAPLILDADAGALEIAPSPEALDAARAAIARRSERRALAQAAALEECRTSDGVRIEVFANLGSEADAAAAVANGAEGCGLLRTEFLFLGRTAPPDEDEQAARYQAIAAALEGRPLIVRTLDVGGDKAVDYLAIPPEENPALGLRGVRVSLWRPDLLRDQVRAILRVEPRGQCRIMIPMVASIDELVAVRAVVDAERAALGYDSRVEVGVMIETPAAAVTADLLAAHADFLSVGTNDLSQYALAMDRGNPQLSADVDALHPAILRLIATAAAGAAKHKRPLGVCGGLASDLTASAILIGLGVTELSAAPGMVAEVKAVVRTLILPDCRDLAQAALALTSARAVRELAAQPPRAVPEEARQ